VAAKTDLQVYTDIGVSFAFRGAKVKNKVRPTLRIF
jgi:hypothetical protein